MINHWILGPICSDKPEHDPFGDENRLGTSIRFRRKVLASWNTIGLSPKYMITAIQWIIPNIIPQNTAIIPQYTLSIGY